MVDSWEAIFLCDKKELPRGEQRRAAALAEACGEVGTCPDDRAAARAPAADGFRRPRPSDATAERDPSACRVSGKREKVAAYIDATLSSSDLSVGAIAVAVGISRSALYRHFEPLGGIARFVQDRRVAALRRAISLPDERRSFAELAGRCGFASASHASRSFKDCFGINPSAYRGIVRAARTGSDQLFALNDRPRRRALPSAQSSSSSSVR